MARHGPRVSEIPAGAGLPSLFNHGCGGYLRGADTEYRFRFRHIRRNLGLYGLYGAAVLLPVQDRQYIKGRIRGALIPKSKHTQEELVYFNVQHHLR
ncbi:hypothetical protein AS222_06105 [Enterococcus faecium]|nr:hypothetical protein AS222_06105 [Enterococcus faecium]KXH20581.1 hypothetical protein AS278_00595 [Enterococcus faecium]